MKPFIEYSFPTFNSTRDTKSHVVGLESGRENVMKDSINISLKKVITFSLWGDNPTYNIGAIKNAELAQSFYPEFECWFYIHTESVPNTTIQCLSSYKNTKVILKSGDLNKCKPMAWRFEAIDDPEVEIMMSQLVLACLLMLRSISFLQGNYVASAW